MNNWPPTDEEFEAMIRRIAGQGGEATPCFLSMEELNRQKKENIKCWKCGFWHFDKINGSE